MEDPVRRAFHSERAGVLAWRQDQANNKEASTPRMWRTQREEREMDGAHGQSVCTWGG